MYPLLYCLIGKCIKMTACGLSYIAEPMMTKVGLVYPTPLVILEPNVRAIKHSTSSWLKEWTISVRFSIYKTGWYQLQKQISK